MPMPPTTVRTLPSKAGCLQTALQPVPAHEMSEGWDQSNRKRSSRLRHAPKKEDGAALSIANEEQERPVGAELGDERPCFTFGLLRHHDDGRGGRCFGALLVDLDKSLVQHLRDKECVV